MLYNKEAVAFLDANKYIPKPISTLYHYYNQPIITDSNCIYPLIYDLDNMIDAFLDCFTNTTKSLEMQEYISNFCYMIETTIEDLIKKSFKPDKPHAFKVFDPKERVILAPRFRTRVVQKALIQVVGPFLDSFAVPSSAANIPGRGTHFALLKVQDILQNSNFVVVFDIHHFFPSIDNTILRCIIYDLIKCPNTNWLLNLNIPDAPIGIPIGSITSQYFANLYLDPLDKLVYNILGITDYCRYMDDFIIGVNTAEQANYVFCLIRDFLYNVLHLTLNQHSRVINSTDEFTFVGYKYKDKKPYMNERRLESVLNEIDKFQMYHYGPELYYYLLRPYIMGFISNASRYTEDQNNIDLIIHKLRYIGITDYSIKPKKPSNKEITKPYGFKYKKSGFFSKEIAKQKRAEKQYKKS